MKFFNNAGPMILDDHYNISPIDRIDRVEIISLIDQKKYFVLHAPRQTGKTSTLLALRDYLNKEGRYYCVYTNFETAQAARENIERGINSILYEIDSSIKFFNADIYERVSGLLEIIKGVAPESALSGYLKELCSRLDKPLVFFIDEIDSLVGDTLISVLRQIRSGYPARPAAFPQAMILCGLREVRDYRIYSDTSKAVITGGSAFNIKSESLRMGDFTKEEIKRLYIQHTEYTGQKFADDIWDYIWELTEGQPWLVNTLAYEACFRIEKDRSKKITRDIIERAKENIIINRMTHIEILIDKLREDRVRRVIEPILSSNDELDERLVKEEDILYVRDLGLIKKKGNWAISNGIYKEIIPRELVYVTQTMMYQDESRYIQAGRLNMGALLKAFQQFFRENSEVWLERFDYKEAGPHLLLMAFLQRIINGGGRIFREYGLGRKRMDIMVEFAGEKFCIELKVYRGGAAAGDDDEDGKGATRAYEAILAKGMEQLADYMDKCGAKEGNLIIFDKTPNKTWKEKLYVKPAENGVTVWGM